MKNEKSEEGRKQDQRCKETKGYFWKLPNTMADELQGGEKPQGSCGHYLTTGLQPPANQLSADLLK